MFRITNEGHGFHITFTNGYTVSVQFGKFAYCSNKTIPSGFEPPVDCRDAEVALLHPEGWLIDLCEKFEWWDGDVVNGWTTPDEVAELIAYAMALPKK